jgi:hypothetical protein
MSELNSAGSEVSADEPEELREYRPISSLAVVGLVGGMLSVLAFVHPVFWFVPVLSAAIGAWALRRLATSAVPLLGRRAAVAGLTLALLFGAAALTRFGVFRWQMRVETMQLSKQWFEALRDRNPYQAHQLTLSSGRRIKADDDLLARYAEPGQRRALEEYVAEPAVRLLLSLGKYAQVRYFANHVTDETNEQPAVIDIYAISVRHAGQTTSCFVQLYWRRSLEFSTKRWSWNLNSAKILKEPPAGWNPAG